MTGRGAIAAKTVDQPGRSTPVPTAPPHLLHVFPSFGFGGVPIRICNVINHFAGRYRHSIVALDNCLDSRSRLEDELQVQLVSVDCPTAGSLRALRSHGSLLRRLRPDLLLTYNWGSIEFALANRLLGVARHLHFESGFGREEADRQLPRRVYFRRLALARTAGVVVPSRTLYETVTRVWRINSNKVRHVPNGVDCERFEPSQKVISLPGLETAPGDLVVGTGGAAAAGKEPRSSDRGLCIVGQCAFGQTDHRR